MRTPASSATSRTAPLVTLDDLAAGIRYLHDHCEKIGRKIPPQIRLGSLSAIGKDFNPDAVLEKAGKLKALGVVGAAVNLLATNRTEWCEYAQRFGEEVLAKLPRN